jgi:uncharacterized BrkB/YihY/UPF0761 family membrane protein
VKARLGKTYDYIRDRIYREKGMRRVWKYRLAVIFLLVVLMGGTAAVSVTIMGITLALLIVALVGALVILFAISRLKK